VRHGAAYRLDRSDASFDLAHFPFGPASDKRHKACVAKPPIVWPFIAHCLVWRPIRLKTKAIKSPAALARFLLNR